MQHPENERTSIDPDPSTVNMDGAVQLIEFIEEPPTRTTTTIQLNHQTIDSVCQNIGNRPICIINVCGPSRQGKSFLLGYVIRRLEALEKDGPADWMGRSDDKRPLKGFKFRNGSTPETQGIWIWSRPFIIKTEGNDDEVAVLLLDTQGTHDEFTKTKDMAAIVGLSLLMSSVMVFNLFTNLQEDVLSALNTYIQYGTLALEEGDGGDGDGYPFQKLSFLIRDWNNPQEFKYGAKGGEKFLHKKLQVKPSQPPEARHIRQSIRSCFQELDCFLMPGIGEEAKSLEFQGSVSELAPAFAIKLEEFINQLVSPEGLVIKKLLNSPLSASQLKPLLETYINTFNSEELPSAESMWEATARIANGNVLEKSLKKYRSSMEEALATAKSPYLSDQALHPSHEGGMTQALNLFRKLKKLGSPELIKEFQDNLIKSIDIAFAELQKENEHKKDKFIQTAAQNAVKRFKGSLEKQFPLGNKTDFYDEDYMREVASQNKSALLEEFHGMLLLDEEGRDKLAAYTLPLEESLEEILEMFIMKNKLNRSIAEREMKKVNARDDCISKLRESFRERIDQVDSFDELASLLESFKIEAEDERRQLEAKENASPAKLAEEVEAAKVTAAKLQAQIDEANKRIAEIQQGGGSGGGGSAPAQTWLEPALQAVGTIAGAFLSGQRGRGGRGGRGGRHRGGKK